MNKRLILSLSFAFVFVLSLFASDKVTRMGQKVILNQGGSSTTSGSTVIVSDSPTNEYKQIVVTATVTGAQTTFTNTFSPVWVSTPTVIQGIKSGQTAGYGSYSVVTVTPTNMYVTLLSTNATMTNGVPYIVYGVSRTGTFQ